MFLCRWSGASSLREGEEHKLLSSIRALWATTAQKNAAKYYRNVKLYFPPTIIALWNFPSLPLERFNNNCQVEPHCIKLSFFPFDCFDERRLMSANYTINVLKL